MIEKHEVLKLIEEKHLSINQLLDYQYRYDEKLKALPLHLWIVKLQERYSNDYIGEVFVLARDAVEAERFALENERILTEFSDARNPSEVIAYEIKFVTDYVISGDGTFSAGAFDLYRFYPVHDLKSGEEGKLDHFGFERD